MNSSAKNYGEFGSVTSVLRKSQSIHQSTGSLSQLNDSYQMSTMTNNNRSASEHSLASSPPSKISNVTALFAYEATGENQLSFSFGDKISVIGEKNEGWQFGENKRTNSYGWFPISYVENSERWEKCLLFVLSKSIFLICRKSNSEANATLRRNQEMSNSNQRDLPMNKYQKIDNPPVELAPLPPSSNNGTDQMRNGSSTTNFSKPVTFGIESSKNIF